MNKLKDNLSVAVYILFIGLTIFGYWHVSKKHSDHEMNICEWFFPIATYHGLEYFWHDDFAGIDWKERNERDFNMITYYYLGYKKDSAKYKLTKDIQEFSVDVNKYPQEQLKYLKNGAKEYILTFASLSNDTRNYCKNYFKGDTSAFMYTEQTDKYLLSLKTNYYFKEDFSVYELNKTLHERLRGSENQKVTQEQINDFLQRMKDNWESDLYSYKQAYKEIFKEEYK